MTKETVQTRIDALLQDLVNTRANLHAIEGAIQDCQYWLSILDETKKEEVDD